MALSNWSRPPKRKLLYGICGLKPEVAKGRCNACCQYLYRKGYDRPVKVTEAYAQRMSQRV